MRNDVRIGRLIIGAVVVALAVAWGPAALAQSDDQTDEIGEPVAVTVATKELEPFVFVDSTAPDGSGLQGYSVDVWTEIALRLNLETTWTIESSVSEILDSTQEGEVDAAIAGISMTAERETFVDFTHPYFDSGLQVAVRPATSQWRTVLGQLTSPGVLLLIGSLVLATMLVAHVVWWSERRHNDEFPRRYRDGIGEALWWSSVSVVTGGEAVKNIHRPLSRIFALAWMIVGLFLLAYVTAQAASKITVAELQSDISGLDDLAGRRIATVESTVAENYLIDANFAVETVDDIDSALAGLAEGRYDAVVYDAPVLAYRINTDLSGQVVLSGDVFAPDPYGIALNTGSDLREQINAELLSMARDGTLQDLNQKWLGVDR